MQIEETLPTLEPRIRAKKPLAEVGLPLQTVAEIAWKFVTESNPVIVIEPEKFIDDDEIQERYHGKWNDACKDYKLVCARPLVYRSYHGTVMSRALVGQEPEK